MAYLHFYLSKVEKITIGIFEDQAGEIFPISQWYPAIVFSYNNILTTARLLYLMKELKVTRKDLFLVNFEELRDKFNVTVCFKIKRDGEEWVLVAEVKMDKETVSNFKKYLKKTKRFIICFGVWHLGTADVISLISLWHVAADSYTEYDGKSVLQYLCEEYH